MSAGSLCVYQGFLILGNLADSFINLKSDIAFGDPMTGRSLPRKKRKSSNVMESVPVDRRNIRFVEPIGPARPYSPPSPAFRPRVDPATFRIQRPLDPRASRGVSRSPVSRVQCSVSGNRRPVTGNRQLGTGIPPRPHAPIQPPSLPKPEASGMSRMDFIGRSGAGGAALFGAMLGLKRKAKTGK